MPVRIAAFTLLALALIVGVASVLTVMSERASHAYLNDDGTINDVNPEPVPWRTTGWETSAAMCHSALPQVVSDYRSLGYDSRSDQEWEGIMLEHTAHCK